MTSNPMRAPRGTAASDQTMIGIIVMMTPITFITFLEGLRCSSSCTKHNYTETAA